MKGDSTLKVATQLTTTFGIAGPTMTNKNSGTGKISSRQSKTPSQQNKKKVTEQNKAVQGLLQEKFQPKVLELYLECIKEENLVVSAEESASEGVVSSALARGSSSIETLVTLFCLQQSGCLPETRGTLAFFFVNQGGKGCQTTWALGLKNLEQLVGPKATLTVLDSDSEEWVDRKKLVTSSTWPVLFIPEFNQCITGLCSILRYLLKHLGGGSATAQALLGHNLSCLSATAEVSSWTKFCEVDLPKATKHSLSRSDPTESHLPTSLAEFETHLSQPLKMHNVRKRMQDAQAENHCTTLVGISTIEEFARANHLYAEGPDCLLSDLILYPHYFLIFLAYGSSLVDLLPLTYSWFQRMSEWRQTGEALANMMDATLPHLELDGASLTLPKVPHLSLYKSDPSRINSASRIFTKQYKVQKALDLINGKLKALKTKAAEDSDWWSNQRHKMQWENIPQSLHPLHGGQLPASRAHKKCQQLENLVLSVLDLYEKRARMYNKQLQVVDFCSGGGHLGLLLASLLPDATVYLVENKAESLERAISRAQDLKLENMKFFQGNVNYFSGVFDIGVSLHACGVATDLVIAKCFQQKADFVSCPCCYGGLQENHVVSYPRSSLFKDASISFSDYLVVGHAADQTQSGTEKLEQGELSMSIIDSDRIFKAREVGYKEVDLFKLSPPSCTPKNNLIIARYA